MSNIFSSNCKLFSITYHLNSGTQCNMLLQDDMCINFQRNRWTSKSCNWFWILDARTIKSTFESISNWGGLERPWGKPSKGSEVWFLSFAFSTSKLLSLFLLGSIKLRLDNNDGSYIQVAIFTNKLPYCCRHVENVYDLTQQKANPHSCFVELIIESQFNFGIQLDVG